MPFSYGNKIKLQIFGQSHSETLGVVIDGLPPGFYIDIDKICKFLERRQGGKGDYTTKRRETDVPKIISGLVNGKTCGSPICAVFENSDIKSKDYSQFKTIPRPSHADYSAFIKYGGANDIRGGGHFSARLTLPLCFAGSICISLLEERDIHIGAHIAAIENIKDDPYDPVNLTPQDFIRDGFPTNNADTGEKMVAAIKEASKDGDSLGGIIECGVTGMTPGIGGPMFGGLEGILSQAIFAIPAVKGIEFGAGFEAANMRGSRHNDNFCYKDGAVKTVTNNAGGILGGISTGMPLVFRLVVKPTPSIGIEQRSVNLELKENASLKITGRHDPCVAPRAVPCVEAVTAIALVNVLDTISAVKP